MLKKFIPFLGKYKRYTVLTLTVVTIEVFLELMIPFLMARIVDYGIQGAGGVDYTVRTGVLMILCSLVSLVFGSLGGRYAAVASMGFAKNIRSTLFSKIQNYSFSNMDKFSTASLVTRLTTDVTNAQNAMMMLIRIAIRGPLMLIGATIMAVTINTRLSLIFFLAIPILGLTLYFIATKTYPRFRIMLERYDLLNEKVQDFIVNIRVVKAFVRENHEQNRFQNNANLLRNAQLNAEKLVAFTLPILQLTTYTSVVCITWFGGNMVIGGTLNVGELSSFIMYLMQVLMALMLISMIFIMLIVSRASLSRIIEAIEEVPSITEDQSESQLLPKNGSIQFKNVSFSYNSDPENLVLTNINFAIESGETIGIIGGTGSSKSTLVQLIPRLYDVFEGEIMVGGHPIKKYPLKTLRDQVAMVLQKNVLFTGTIKDNLKWGNEHASDFEIEKAAKDAQAHEFILSFPKGYDTMLGQGGVNVSGGQKQRLSIARALLKKPKIVILDDSTSAVDTTTDKAIRTAFKEKLTNTTTLIIAQRITSVQDADRIIVMDDGEIKAFDTHERLMETNDIYQEIYRTQSRGGMIHE